MREVELYINSHRDIQEAIFYTDNQLDIKVLKSFLTRTNLKTLYVTGFFTSKYAQTLVEELTELSKKERFHIPDNFSVKPYSENDVLPEMETLVFWLKDARQIEAFTGETWKHVVGYLDDQPLNSFYLWEKFRKDTDHIHIVKNREMAEAQVLSWDKNADCNIEISVIFPMYNVEKYLDECIESVTKWDADYIEFLFVNDGSPDNSREKVLEWAKNDSRIKLLDKPNGGCASARQHGLEHAKGRYIGFIDPDDYIDPSMYKKLFEAAMTGGYEISYCGYNEYYENTGTKQEVCDDLGGVWNDGVCDANRINELIAFARVAIWRGIYSAEMLKRANIHFYTDLRRFDDLPFKVETFATAKSVITVEEPLYYYRLARPGQDVSADDDRLYVHFPIFQYLNESIASSKDQKVIDYLQICKIQTHIYAIRKIQRKYLKEYVTRARKDLLSTGKCLRTFFLAKAMVGRKSALYCFLIYAKNIPVIKFINKHMKK